MKKTLLKGLHWYQDHSWAIAQMPILLVAPQCRFHPSCSEYAIRVVERYGVAEGLVKALMRIARCNPFSTGGIDLP
ncbi:MAG: membrane protein insertion efficiency factor YidD [Patescibacteria group bacterium]